MNLSIIMPISNSQNTLEKAFGGLITSINRNCELILVDNNSNDHSLQLCRQFRDSNPDQRILIHSESKRGPSAVRNAGASLAGGEWLVFVDSDCVASVGWISDYLAYFYDPYLGAVAGCIRPYPPSTLVQKLLSLFTLQDNKTDLVYSATTLTEGLFPSANLAVRRDVFNLIDGFNEGLRFGEDHDLCFRIYQSGFKIRTVTNSVFQHIHRTTLRGLIRQSFGFGTAHPYELRHFTSGAIILSFPLIQIVKPCKGIHIWIDMNQADKKLAFLLVLGLSYWPLYILLPFFFTYLCVFIDNKAKEKGVRVRLIELPSLALLLILKSFCLTLGRVYCSFRYRVICF